MKMAVLKHLHPMIGVDFHDEIAPPGIPAPKIPHLTAGLLCFPPWGVVTGKPNGTVWTTHAMSLAQGTDMGFLIPHIPLPPAPANLLAPILTLVSGSKSHFGAHNHLTPQGPLAFACLVVVNLNLNCAGPTMPPLPTGFVFAVFQLTWQGVTLGDLIAGALHMLVDIVVQHLINRFLSRGPASKAFDWLNRKIGGALAARTYVNFVKLSAVGAKTVPQVIQAVMQGSRRSLILGYGLIEQAPGILAGYAIGTPIGYSPAWAPTSQAEGYADQGQDAVARGVDWGADKVQGALHRFFDNPAIEQHPSPGTTSGPPVMPAPPTSPPSAAPPGTPSPVPQAPPTPPASGGH
jgi:hypothetical protein